MVINARLFGLLGFTGVCGRQIDASEVRIPEKRKGRGRGGFPGTVEIEPVRSGINRAWSMRW